MKRPKAATFPRHARTLMKGRTSVVIARRLSTIRDLDRIVVLEGGRAVEEGDHGSLMELAGRYAALIQVQPGGLDSGLLEADLAPGAASEHGHRTVSGVPRQVAGRVEAGAEVGGVVGVGRDRHWHAEL
ncbi:MAG: hypothetical protein ACOYM2_14310, partial [Rectinemataceae bacterium]